MVKRATAAGEQQERMLRAAAQGSQAAAQGRRELAGQYERAGQAGAEAGFSAVRTGMAAQQQAHGQTMDKQQMALRERGMDLEEAKAGYMRNPALDARAQKLQEEMARGAAQGEKPIEQGTGGARPLIPTPEAEAAGEAAGKQAQAELNIKQIEAESKLIRAKADFQRAKMNGDMDGQQAAIKTMVADINQTRQMLDDLQAGKRVKLSSDIQSLAKIDPRIAKAYGGEDEGAAGSQERLREVLESRLAAQAMHFTAETGGYPPGFDPSNPIFDEWRSNYLMVKEAFEMQHGISQEYEEANPDLTGQHRAQRTFAQWSGLTTKSEKDAFLRKTAAEMQIWKARQQMKNPPVPMSSGMPPPSGGSPSEQSQSGPAPERPSGYLIK